MLHPNNKRPNNLITAHLIAVWDFSSYGRNSLSGLDTHLCVGEHVQIKLRLSFKAAAYLQVHDSIL